MSGQVKEASFYNNGNLDGMHVRYHENGEVKTSGQYSQNHKEGVWSWLNKDGELERVETYNKGLLDGQWKQLYANGKIKFQGTYANNKRTGQWMWYDIDGKDTHSKIY